MTARDRPLRVVHLGTADRVGGAARAQWRMHEALRGAGVDSRILCGYKSVEGQDDRVAQVPAMHSLPAKAIRKLAHAAERWTGREYHLLPWGRRFLHHPWVQRADVIHLHNLHGGFFPIRQLPRLARVAPLVWSVHDLWPTTGHCYFPQMTGCRCWTGESACIDPQQDGWYPLKRNTSRWLWERKRKLISESQPIFVAQSAFTQQWLGDAPISRGQTIVRIPYPLDTHVFRPTPTLKDADPETLSKPALLARQMWAGTKHEARGMLSLPAEGPIVMFSAVSLGHPRKGGADVLSAVSHVAERLRTVGGALTLLTVGGDGGALVELQSTPGLNIVSLGQVDDDRALALAYSAADVFVGASKVETFGQVFSEAAACGTPGLAYDTSGVRDAVRDGETGVLVPPGDADAMGDALHALLVDGPRRAAMGEAGRAVCVAEYAYPVVARQLVALYESRLLGSAPLDHDVKDGGGDA